MTYGKMYFHTGPGGNPTGIGDSMRTLNNKGVPFFLKSVDHYGPLYEAHHDIRPWNAEHTLVFRLSTQGQGDGFDYDVPNYYIKPEDSGDIHFDRTVDNLPPEMDRSLVWLEPINEVRYEPDPDKPMWGGLHPCEWMGRFAIQYANRSLQANMRCALFAWASGNPERSGWEQPSMLNFLRLCAQHPEQVAVALHEYSYNVNNILDGAGYKIGRFEMLFDVCDTHGIARPTVLITEWGWALDNVPAPDRAIADIDKVMRQYYAKYAEVKGAAIWYLGPGFGDIANKAQKLIAPLTEHNSNTVYDDPEPGPEPPDPPDGDCPGEYRVQFHRRYVLLPDSAGPEWATAVAEASYDRDPGDFTVGKSADDAGGGDLEEITVIPVNPQEWQDSIREFFAQYYPRAEVLEVTAADPAELKEKIIRYIQTGSFDPPPTPTPGFDSPVGWDGNQAGDKLWPDHYIDANPIGTSYAQGKHTGSDLNDNVTAGWDSDALAPTFAIGDGVVTCAQRLGGTWGPVVVNDHGPVGPFPRICSRHGHLKDFTVQAGQPVTRGQQLGRIGNADGQLAYHLHFDIAVGDVLINNPGDWPGSNFDRVVRNYLEPRSFLRLSRPGMVWPDPKPGTANASVNFRTGPGTSFAIYRTLAAGTAVTVLNILDGWYLLKLADGAYGWCSDDYIDIGNTPPPDPEPQPPPYQYKGRAVTFHPALHGPADDWAWQLGEVQGVHNQVELPVKFLSNGMNHQFFPAFSASEFHIVRIMWHAHTATPAQFWDEVKGDFGRMYNAGARQFEIHNEPNLTSEGLGTAWADGAAFGAWLKDVIGLIRAQYGTNVKLYYPGCSPGVPWTNQFAFTDKAWPVVRPLLDGFCLHAYTGDNADVEKAAAEIANQVIEAQAYLNLQVPLVVSEASVNRGTNYQQKAAVYHRVEELLHGRAGIEAICWYISDWRNPPPDQADDGEAWVGTPLPALYKQ